MSEWDEYAPDWDDDPAARAYSRAAFNSLTTTLDRYDLSVGALRVCDFGCGTGLLTEQLADAGATVFAIDTSPKMLAILDDKINRRGWQQVSTSLALPAESQRFDLIVASSVCSFLDDYPGTVVDLATRLDPGGLFVQWDWEADEANEDPHGLSREAVHTALSGADLSNVQVDVGFEVAFEDQMMRPLMGHGRRQV